MIQSFHNSALSFSLELEQGTWSLEGTEVKGPVIENAQMSVRYRNERGGKFTHGQRDPLQAGGVQTTQGACGRQKQVTCYSVLDRNAIRFQVTFALPEEEPFLLWKITLENRGSQPIFVDRIEMFNAGFIYLPPGASPTSTVSRAKVERSLIRPARLLGDLAFFSHGWQSWNYTGVFGERDTHRKSRLGPFTAPMYNPGTPTSRRRGLLGSDMFGVLGDRLHRTGILAGFLSQEEQFGSLEALLGPLAVAMRMWANGDSARLDPGKSMATDWACIQFIDVDAPYPLDRYFGAVARQHGLDGDQVFPSSAVPTGWSSWYQFFQMVTATDVRANLQAASRLRDQLPLQIVQIDDGSEAQVGDWLDFSPAFPEGVAPLAAEIRAEGFKPGLWLAPFIVHPKAGLITKHPQWILRNQWGRPVNAGFHWDHFTTALDLTSPGALEYACEVVGKAVHDWGYDLLKLDFLYAAALQGKYQDSNRTRAQVMRTGLKALRQAAGEKTELLGCGCPLGSAIGLVDSMRISPDVDQRWSPAYKGIRFFFQNEPNMPSARNAIQNTLTRSGMHRKWWVNDPDCLLLRPDTYLNDDEVRTLAAVIAFSGGTLMLSDHLPDLPPDRLRIGEQLLPLITRRPHVLDWFDHPTPERLQLELNGAVGDWSLLALFNWEDKRCDLQVDMNDFHLQENQEYLARSFWDGQIYRFRVGDSKVSRAEQPPGAGLVIKDVPAHASVLLAVRPVQPQMPAYLGSDLHISQGLEVIGWQWDGDSILKLSLNRPGKAHGFIVLALPHPPEKVNVNDSQVLVQPGPHSSYQIHVEFNKTAQIEIYL